MVELFGASSHGNIDYLKLLQVNFKLVISVLMDSLQHPSFHIVHISSPILSAGC